MKKFICFILSTLFIFTSCEMPYLPPYGKWESADGTLILDINPETPQNFVGYSYSGVYLKDNVLIDVTVYFRSKWRFLIFDASKTPVDMDNNREGESLYFYGEYSLNFSRNKIKYKLFPDYREKTGYPEKQIVFNKVEDYLVPKKLLFSSQKNGHTKSSE